MLSMGAEDGDQYAHKHEHGQDKDGVVNYPEDHPDEEQEQDQAHGQADGHPNSALVQLPRERGRPGGAYADVVSGGGRG